MEVKTNGRMNRIERPGSVTTVSLFYWLNALALGAIGVVVAFSLVSPSLNSTLPSSWVSEEMSNLLLFGGLVVALITLAIFTAVVGWGLSRLKGWARRAAIVMSSLVIVVNIGVFVNGLIKGQVLLPYRIVLHGLVLWVLTGMNVRVVFESMSTEPDMPIAEKGLEKEQGIKLETGITCSNCGNAVLPKDRFCRKCGYALQ